MPTVEAFKPDRNAYAMAGRTSLIRCTPSDKAYIPMAPGKLVLDRLSVGSPTTDERRSYLQARKTITAGMRPAWIKTMQNSILVLPGPGSACPMANSS